MSYSVAVRSHTGNRRPKNEDSYFIDKEYPGLIIVADGIGGYEGGKEASSIITENVKPYFSAIKDGWDNYSRQLSNYLRFVNYKIIEKQMKEIKFCHMGSTATAIYLDNNNEIINYSHIGDCRLLVVRNGKCIQVTDDHNELGELIKNGLVDKSEFSLQNKNKLTKYLGQSEEIEPDTGVFKIVKNDIVLIATDGVFGNIGNEEVAKAISASRCKQPKEAVNISEISDYLLQHCLKVDGSDNITFVMLYFI